MSRSCCTLLALIFPLLLLSCSSSPTLLSGESAPIDDAPLGALDSHPECDTAYSPCILISDIEVLNGTTFPFDCIRTNGPGTTLGSIKGDRVNECSDKCLKEQFMNLSETYRPTRRNEPRNGRRDATVYQYYPQTRSYLDDRSAHWHITTETATDEVENSADAEGTLIYSSSGHFHTGEDWNLGSGSYDDEELVYAIGRGVVLFQGDNGGYGNTIQIVHKVCRHNHYPHPEVETDCELVLSSYSHLNNRDWGSAPRKGEVVQMGQAIARVGGTGGYPPHLHLEIRRGEQFLERLSIDGREYVRLYSSSSRSPSYWPGTNDAFIREHYYDPTEFIKQNAGILVLQKHNVTDTRSERIELPQAGILVADLSYPPGDVGDTQHKLTIRNDDSDESLRLSGNTRPLEGMRGGTRVVIWGERDRPTEAGWFFHLTPEIVSGSDSAVTPFNLTAVLYPYSGNHLASLKPIPTRPLFFDPQDIPDQWYAPNVHTAYDFGILGGYGSVSGTCPSEIGEFCPGNPINRVEFFTILMAAINATYHTTYEMPRGLSGTEWYARAIATALDWEILTDADIDEIDANNNGSLEATASELARPLTRREAARYIARAFQINQGLWWRTVTARFLDNRYSDLTSEDPDYLNILALTYARDEEGDHPGVISGYPDGTFRPSNNILRGEMATMIGEAVKVRLEQYIP